MGQFRFEFAHGQLLNFFLTIKSKSSFPTVRNKSEFREGTTNIHDTGLRLPDAEKMVYTTGLYFAGCHCLYAE